MSESNAVILPRNVRPLRYDLTLIPNVTAATFRGEESVDVELLEPTTTIVLNCSEIEIAACRLDLSDGSQHEPVETVMDETGESVTFRFDTALAPGAATLHLEFTGLLNDKLRGFYRSTYTDQDGNERHLATTQFEATDARRAFPCWDEPALKAVFKVALLVPEGLTAVSNMRVTRESPAGDGMKRVEFGETPLMSTYLLAFVVGDLKSIEQEAPDGTLMRVWATPGKEEHGRFALDLSIKLLSYFNGYFGIPYPIDKLDHLAIPDFAAGAMENWGAITYRETALLVDPERSSAETRELVASIVAHEMAHMWFGDLVTMAWWNDLWLNESFASWMGDKAVDHLFPEWDKWSQFVSTDTNRALSLDGLQNSHPIEQEVKDPAEIGQLFDAISYSKGGSVLRMLERFVGADAFQRGLKRYLTRHEYANARTHDLWDALGEASGQPVAAMMDTWVNQTGYPVLDVRTRREDGGAEIAAEQRRFVYEHIVDPEGTDDTLWHVPLSARASAGEPAPPTLMSERRATMRLPAASGSVGDRDWIKINPEQTGFYRVNYSPDDWSRLGAAVRDRTLPPIDRLGIQNDAYALSRAGYLPVTQFLELADSYTGETEQSVWGDLASNLGGLDTLLGDQPYYDAFESLARRLFRPIGDRVGWDAGPDEGHLDALLRGTVLSELGRYGDREALDEAARRFAGYLEDNAGVHPNIRDVVFALAARSGDASTFDTMWDLYLKADLEEDKVRFLRSMTHVEDINLLAGFLERSLTPDVRVHNTIGLVAGVASNRLARDLSWQFVKDNWEEFDRRYGEGGFGLMRLVSITQGFTTQEKLEDVRGFFEEHPAPAADRSIRQSLERIRLNIAWLERNAAELAGFFSD